MEVGNGFLCVGEIIASDPTGIVIASPTHEVFKALPSSVVAAVDDLVEFPLEVVLNLDRRWWRRLASGEWVRVVWLEERDVKNIVDGFKAEG